MTGIRKLPLILATLLGLVVALSPAVTAAHADDLSYYLPPGEVLWLGASEEEIAEAREAEQPTPLRAMLLNRENEQAYDRGHILLIPELGTHPLQSSAIRHWYQGMPAYGWYTYALQSPTMQVNEFAWDVSNSERYPQAEDISELHQAMRERLELAFGEMNRTAGPTIMIAEGVSAALISDLMARGEIPPVDAFVALGAHYPQWQLNHELATTTAQLNVPVLDLVPAHQHEWISSTHARRQQQAQRHQHPAYRQRKLSHQRVGEQPRYLLHQLYGWLRSEDF